MEVDNECRMLNKKNKQKEVDMCAKKKTMLNYVCTWTKKNFKKKT